MSIVERGENSYRFTVYVGKDANGKYKRETMTYKVTEKFTPKKLKEHLDHEYLKFKQQVMSGEYITPEKMSFVEFSKDWEKKFAKIELSETTYQNRYLVLKNHILPVIGHVTIDKIKPILLVDLLENLTRKDGKDGELSVSAKEDVYKALMSVFKYAKQWGIISINPMDGVSKPKANKSTKKSTLNIYELDEIELLFKAVEKEAFHWRVFISLALAAGLRRGELLGLEWSKVDFENKRIDIDTTIVKADGALIKGPKSKASNRLVAIPESIIKELEYYKDYWIAEKNAMGSKWIEQERSWLFCNEDGTHFYPDTPSTWWRRFTERNKIRHIRLHDLRHTSASLLIAENVHAKVIAERLGHSKISVTMDTYGHLLRSADQDAAAKLNNLFLRK
ncbi:site-specific integrase [Sporosarcina sp. P37]|uniref:tyrosine-type recombinase/integrase n=1 Tax=unclassified Sporosarcina TaxID=2647733 RepID=UPI000A17E1C7|nr:MULTISPECIES: site-specific integrase [unclassified Sporosarcina]ARK25594.1 site-specific integrase [Sporosarcina sp. P37]PID17309.1 site-specific integrase [Sporosarcina sp. P35]